MREKSMSKHIIAWLWGLSLLFSGVSLAAAQEPCSKIEFGGAAYLVCTAPAQNGNLKLFWKNAEGEPYRAFSAVADAKERDGDRLIFAFNAGMYHDDFSPLGLYVEKGEEMVPINTTRREGSGASVPNFYKKPNGVFYLAASGVGIVTTEEFLKLRPKVVFATQSGPMLVINGETHPAFIEGSTDRKRRSGVGICDDGLVRFAISEDPVNFHDFALMFKDHLSCPNALFLDGGRGAGIYAPGLGRNDVSWHGGFGPIIGVVE